MKRFSNVVLFGALANILLLMLFPPFEAFPWAGRVTVGSFDGFCFAFGDEVRRQIFLPMLTLEMIYVLINACAFWLLMGMRERKVQPEPAERRKGGDRRDLKPGR